VDLVVPALAKLVVNVYLRGSVNDVTGPGWIIPVDQIAPADLPPVGEPSMACVA